MPLVGLAFFLPCFSSSLCVAFVTIKLYLNLKKKKKKEVTCTFKVTPERVSCGKKVEKRLCFFPLLRCVFEQRFIVQEAVFFLCAFTLRCFRSSTAHMEVQARTAAKNTTFGLFFLHASFFFFPFPSFCRCFFFFCSLFFSHYARLNS